MPSLYTSSKTQKAASGNLYLKGLELFDICNTYILNSEKVLFQNKYYVLIEEKPLHLMPRFVLVGSIINRLKPGILTTTLSQED